MNTSWKAMLGVGILALGISLWAFSRFWQQAMQYNTIFVGATEADADYMSIPTRYAYDVPLNIFLFVTFLYIGILATLQAVASKRHWRIISLDIWMSGLLITGGVAGILFAFPSLYASLGFGLTSLLLGLLNLRQALKSRSFSL
jgi:hypothetical protein